jgi:uncharacterized glyoxalase superfamily protein PhnB
MKTPPTGWPRISSQLFYDDPHAALQFLQRAFGFEVRARVEGPGGRLEHCEMALPDGLVMVGHTGGMSGDEAKPWRARQRSPQALQGSNTQSLCVYVDDVDAHCERARAHGAMVVREPETSDYGEGFWADRTYGALDPEGHLWWFMQRVRG